MAIGYKTCMTVLTATLLLSTPAWADDLESDGMGGDGDSAYVFASIGGGWAYNACQPPIIPGGQTCRDKNLIYRVGYGYQFTPHWALEVNGGQFGYADSEGVSTFAAPVGTGNYNWQMKVNGLALQAVTTLHMTTHTAVFAKFGVARLEFDESLDVMSSSNGAYYAVGTVNDKANVAALAAGFQIDTGPHGSIRFMAESFGSHAPYFIYGSSKIIRLLSGTVAFMYRY